MFFYTSNRKFNCDKLLKLEKITELDPRFNQVAQWVEDQWGYIRNHPGLAERKKRMKPVLPDLNVVTYDRVPVAMFALTPWGPNKSVVEINYFYVDASFRDLGIGSWMFEKAKTMAKAINPTVVLDTLNPKINHFYEKHGFKVIADHNLNGFPTSILRMK